MLAGVPRPLIPLALFVGAYMLGFGAWALSRGNVEFIFYGAVMLALIGAVLLMHRRVGFSGVVLWGLAVWGFLHMAGGTVPIPREFMASTVPDEGTRNVLYNFRAFAWTPKYDQVTHAFGFGVATLAAWEALRSAAGGALRPSWGVRFALVCAGMGLGAINEVVEFVAVLTIPNTNVGGYENTGWDLISNLAGCVIAAGLVRGEGSGGGEARLTAGVRGA